MSYEKGFDDFMPNEVTVDPWQASDAWGVHALSTAARVSVQCRIEQNTRKVIDLDGNEILSRTTLFMKPTTTSSGAFEVHHQDRITLPSTAFNPQTPPIIVIERAEDDEGLHHWEVAL